MAYKRRIIWLLLVVTCQGRTLNQPEQSTNQEEPNDLTTEASNDYLDSILFQIGGAIGPGWDTDNVPRSLNNYDVTTVNVFDQNNIQSRSGQHSLTQKELEECANGFSYRSGLINCEPESSTNGQEITTVPSDQQTTPSNQPSSTAGQQTTTTPSNQPSSTAGQQTTTTSSNQPSSTVGQQTTTTPSNQPSSTVGQQTTTVTSTTEAPTTSQHDNTKTTPSTIPSQSTTTMKPMLTPPPVDQMTSTTTSSIMLPSPPLNPNTQGAVTPTTPSILSVSQTETILRPNTPPGPQIPLYPTPNGQGGMNPFNPNMRPINQGNWCGSSPCGQNNGPFHPGFIPNNQPNWNPGLWPQYNGRPFIPSGFPPNYNVPPMRPNFMPFGRLPPMHTGPFGNGQPPYPPTGVQMPVKPSIILSGWPFQNNPITFNVNGGVPAGYPSPYIRVANGW